MASTFGSASRSPRTIRACGRSRRRRTGSPFRWSRSRMPAWRRYRSRSRFRRATRARSGRRRASRWSPGSRSAARIWPGIMLGAAIANLGVIGTPVSVALAIGAGNAAEAIVAGLLIRRFVGIRHRFEQPAAVWKFARSPSARRWSPRPTASRRWRSRARCPGRSSAVHWLTWWLGDATGIVIVAPLLLCWSEAGNGSTAEERRIEYQLFAALLRAVRRAGLARSAMPTRRCRRSPT